ncbi:FecCD family ABC transporter permease [Brucellaceae bacterium D45D]
MMIPAKFGFPFCIGALCIVSFAHLRLGAVSLDLATIHAAIGRFDSGNYNHIILWNQRLPRLAVAIFCGASLGLSGWLLQKLFQNGLVSPSTLGINAGATNFVVLGIGFGWDAHSLQILQAFLGATAAVAFSLFLASLFRNSGNARLMLVLAGAMTATVFSALTTFVVSLDPDRFAGLIGWLIGNIGTQDHRALPAMLPLAAIALLLALVQSRQLDLLALGEDQAQSIGVNVRWCFRGTLASAILLAVCAVTVVGPIGFVGLVIPHLVRIAMGEAGRLQVALSMFMGACVLVLADILARTLIAPRVLNVGTVMGLAGGMIFLALVLWAARRGRI